jgi:YidC/Oxa1 family membrane protein insertase
MRTRNARATRRPALQAVDAMEKRVLLAISLSFVVLFVYQTLFVKPAPKPVSRPETPAAATGSAGAAPAGPAEARTPQPQATQPAAVPDVATLVGDTEEREIVVESEAVLAVFTNRGAELKSWVLKKYLDEAKRPVDLVPGHLPADVSRPFGLVFDDETLTARLRRALYRPSASRLDLASGNRQLAFDYQDASGLRVRKTFDFEAGGQPYSLAVTIEAFEGERRLTPALTSGPGIGDTERAAGSGGSFLSPSYYQKPEAIFHRDGKVTRLAATKLTAEPRHEGAFRYLGTDDHYFISAVLLADRQARADYRPMTVTTPHGPRELVSYDLRFAEPVKDLKVYLGPKHFDVLAPVDRELVRVINFGMFSWLVVPLLRALNWINGFAGNYGVSIILLTIFINVAIFPLRHKSMVSMRKMQELQPRVKAIQERYAGLKATDPARQKMNTELMNLYREHGVNPASGCVPMLLTFPVLFAFYSMLSQAIELRNAPFFGWITDLSTHDPWYITPLLMGATMVWQQKITPTTADPVQAKVMMFMPIMFTFMFLWAPSGLVVYWFMSNVLAIGQQYLTNHLITSAKTAKAGR